MSPLNGSEVDAGIASLRERYIDLLARDADARASNHSANAKLTKIHAQVVQSRASLNNHQSGLPFSDWRKSLKVSCCNEKDGEQLSTNIFRVPRYRG